MILLFLFRRKYQHDLEIYLEGIFKQIIFPQNNAHPYLTTHTNAQKGWAYFRGTTVPHIRNNWWALNLVILSKTDCAIIILAGFVFGGVTFA